MWGSQNKLNNKRSQKSSHSQAQTESKLSLILRLKINSTKSQGKKHKVKSKSRVHKFGNLPTWTVNDSSKKRSSKNSSIKKLIIRQNLHKTTDGKSSQKLSSSALQGENNSFSAEKEEKYFNGEVKIQKLKKRRRKKRRQRDNAEIDDASRLQRRTRYLLVKMKLEQNLIDAYSGEGWKGQSREKIRPEKELQRAQKQILKCKLGIRDAIRQLDCLSSVGSIEDSDIAPDGSVYHEHIFCAMCKLRETFPDNDIILCDGTCNRAFHQKCLDPPLDTKNIPPGEQGWFCKFCESKMIILEVVNAHLGTHFSMDSTWQDVFKEEAAFPDGDSALNPEEEWPSDDSEDDDYNPDRREDSHSISTEGTDDNASNDLSSSTSLWSLDGEYSSGKGGISHECFSVNSCMDSDEYGEIGYGRRQRKAVDYKKLYDEMFGKVPACEQISEDEDWGPGKRKRREKESDAVNTLMTLRESENKYSNNDHGLMRNVSPCIQIRRPCLRIPHDAVEKLRQAFAENELPPRYVKEGLSQELGLDAEKVSKWFKNARYLALKTRKQAEGAQQLQSLTFRTSKDSRLQNLDNAELLTSKEDSRITLTHLQKNVNDTLRKQKKSSTSPLNKRQQEVSARMSTDNGNKDIMEFSDDVLKKLQKARKRKTSFIFEGDSQEAEMEFERLSEVKVKLDSMKQKLIEIQNYRAKNSDEPHSNEQSVIYVPIAELREKVEL